MLQNLLRVIQLLNVLCYCCFWHAVHTISTVQQHAIIKWNLIFLSNVYLEALLPPKLLSSVFGHVKLWKSQELIRLYVTLTLLTIGLSMFNKLSRYLNITILVSFYSTLLHFFYRSIFFSLFFCNGHYILHLWKTAILYTTFIVWTASPTFFAHQIAAKNSRAGTSHSVIIHAK